MAESNLSHAITIYRAMSSRRLAGGEARGNIVLSDALRPSLDKAIDFGWTLDNEHQRAPNGQEIELEFSVPRGQSTFFAADWADLLSHHNFSHEKPQAFYVAEDDYASDEKKPTVSSRRYTSTQGLIKMLREVADYADVSIDGGLKLIFLNQTKLELPVAYSAGDLRDVPKVKALEDDIVGANIKHKDQRKAIMKVVLNEMLAAAAPEKRFVELLKKFPDFAQRYKDSYELYVAEFSFEKVLEEVNAHKLDYTIKLNKVFSDIQNQLLAVPAALLIIGSKLAPKGYVEWQNSLTVLGCVIFVAFMDMLIRNQYNSLQAVLDEMSGQHDALIRRHPALISKFKAPYEELEKRHAHQKFLIRIVDGMVGVMFAFCIILYCWYSTPESHWLKYWVASFIG